MEEKIKDITLFIAVIVIASLGYYYYQSYTQPFVSDDNVVEQDVVGTNTKTSDSVTSQQKTTPISQVNNLPLITEDGVYLVYYLKDGFYPRTLQIRQGTSVRFINKSDNAMRVFTSNDQEFRFSQMNQDQTVGKGGTYDFTFIDEGVWAYFNKNNQSHTANILVY